MKFAIVAICFAFWCSTSVAQPAPAEPSLNDKYHVTPEERAACSGDAVRLCSEAYPDEDALIACMKANHKVLSLRCKTSFDAGLKRRHL